MTVSKNENEPNKDQLAGRSAIWYTAATFLTKGLGFITIPIFTRLMTTGEFGLFNNFAAWQILLLAVLSLEGYATVNRARLDYSGRELQEYQFTVLVCGMGLTLFVGIILVVVPWAAEAATGLDRIYLIFMVLYLFFYPSFGMFQALQRTQYRYKLSAGLSFGTSLAAVILSVVLVVTMPDALLGRIMGQYLPFTILGVFFFGWYFKTGGSFKTRYLRYALPLCVPLVIATLGSQMLLLGCRIVTQHTCGPDEVAFLSLATTVSNIALILIGALNSAWAPFFYDCLEAGEEAKARRVLSVYCWGLTLLDLAVAILAPELVLILGGEQYAPTVALVPAFMASCLFSMLSNQYILLETYNKDVRAGGIVTLVIGFLNLPLCAALIMLFGFEFVGFANLISNIFLVFIHAYIIKGFGGKDVFAVKTLLPPALATMAIIPICTVVYQLEMPVVRYIIIGVMAVIAIVLCIVFVYRKNRESN